METIFCRLDVLFEAPFWVGVFRLEKGGELSAARVVFGRRPSDGQIYEFVLKNYCGLKFSPRVSTKATHARPNPKRRRREAKKAVAPSGTGTKSQRALRLARRQNKTRRKSTAKNAREEKKRLKFSIKQQKKIQKHKGR